MNSHLIYPRHTPIPEWAESYVEPLAAMVATAAALAGLAEVAWRPLIAPTSSGLSITLSGQLGAAYTGDAARAEIVRYAKTWPKDDTDGIVHQQVIDGDLIVTALVTVEDYLPARVWANTGPADPTDFALVGEHYAREAKIAAECGPGVA